MSVHPGPAPADESMERLAQELDIPVELLESVQAVRNAKASLGAALASVERPVSPQLARRMQATENAWRAIGKEFGLLTAAEVGELLIGRAARDIAHRMRTRGELLAVRRTNAYLYPGFQFNSAGRVMPWVEPLKQIAAEAHWPDGDVLLWMCNPSGRLSGQRPVDVGETEPGLLLELAQLHLSDAW